MCLEPPHLPGLPPLTFLPHLPGLPLPLFCRPHILVRGLMAHGVAEALLNAPQVGRRLACSVARLACELLSNLPANPGSCTQFPCVIVCAAMPRPLPAQVLGSLSLLFNPTGLVRSVRAGVGDLIGLPLAALQNQSLSQFISGVGLGSVSLVKHTLGARLCDVVYRLAPLLQS